MTYERPAKLCNRCAKYWRFGFNWPEGYVCRSCVTRAVKIQGRCPRCRIERLLVGRDGDDRPICVDCAGITTCFTCSTCGTEAQQWFTRTCLSCSLSRRLGALLDDGTGHISVALWPLFEKLTSSSSPIGPMTWLNKPAVRRRLTDLADGSTPLTHEGIDTMAGVQGREFLRELLMETGVLPRRDKYLAAFSAWRHRRLTSISDPATRAEISTYLAWRHMRDLTVRSEAGRLTASATGTARDQTDAAVRFLGFVSDRGLVLSKVRQNDIDDWFATASNPFMARDFIIWAIQRRRCGRLKVPSRAPTSAPGCSSARLAEITQRLLTDQEIELGDRVAGLIVVLFAQHVTKVSELQLSDLIEVKGEFLLKLGPEPVVLPSPVAALVSRYAGERWNMTTTNTSTDFLFPGTRPGEHIIAMQLRHRLGRLGITKAERQGSLTHLLSEVPAAVVAKATGYSSATTATRAAQVGTDWAGYAALRRAGAGRD
jgi:hypothetical protein